MERLFDLCNEWMYHNCDCVDWDMESYCWQDGFWSWDDTIDDDGNLLDGQKVITIADLQAACDNVGIDIDSLNF